MKKPTNFCDNCLPNESSFSGLLFDTGLCSFCKKIIDVIDIDLVGFYQSLGFTDDFIYEHLPRLRDNLDSQLTMVDIGKEIGRHIVIGACTTHACQGYGLRDKWQFNGAENTQG